MFTDEQKKPVYLLLLSGYKQYFGSRSNELKLNNDSNARGYRYHN